MNRNELKEKIDKAKIAYYNTDTPIMSDKEYDELIKKYGSEPYVGAPILNSIQKINITDKPMLSLDKVHNEKEIIAFSNGYDIIASVKCDGLSVRLIYQNGKLISANTRGNGIEGADITEHIKYFLNVPLTITKKEKYIIDGEAIIYDKDFQIINQNHQFKNNRNTASGALSLLDMNIVKQRRLSFVAWDVIKGGCSLQYYHYNMEEAELYGFTIVPSLILDYTKMKEEEIKYINQTLLKTANIQGLPCDGIVWRINDLQEGNNRGQTAHHFLNAVAWKPHDETYTTQLQTISWSMGRTGVLTPVAIFDPVIIDGTEVTRASLHNVSVMKETLGDCAYPGETLEVAKMNQIIPQIISAGPKYDYGYVIAHGGVSANDVPEKCPICGFEISYKTENGITRAYCDNPTCEGKLINILDHFCGKKGLDIKGLSKMTLEKLIDWGWINNISDIFNLKDHRNEWIKKPGFGVASVDKVLKAIEDSRNCSTDKFICAIGIPLIGKVASVALAKTFGNYQNFIDAVNYNDEKLYQIDGIGEVMIDTLRNFDYFEANEAFNYINETAAAPSVNGNELKEKVFVITGKLKTYKNRNELKTFIESKGGKVTDSVTKKTSYLINNDITSTSSKNLTAQKLNVPIIDEATFITLLTSAT